MCGDENSYTESTELSNLLYMHAINSGLARKLTLFAKFQIQVVASLRLLKSGFHKV